MKKIFILFIMTFTSAVCADFLDAGEAYENKNYSQALKEYQALAELGHYEAQHNLAVMYFLGQGTDKNPVQAYAWATLAKHSEDNKLQALQSNIKAQLDTTQLAQAEQLPETLQQQYGQQAIAAQWAPPQEITSVSDDSDYKLKILKTKAPSYPYKSLQNGEQGWVTLSFEIHPDGSLRRPIVAQSYPEGLFDEPTLKVIRDFRFKLDFKDGVEPYPITARQTIIYSLTNKQSRYQELYNNRIQELQVLADKGHPDAYYHLAMAISENSPLNEALQLKTDQAAINQLLFSAAQGGHTQAQYYLGNNLYSGKSGYQDKAKGVRWLMLAAENGQAQAARRLSLIFKANPEMNQTEHPAEYWLAQAAEQGDLDAQLNFAEWLADNSDDSAQIQQALKLLDNYADKRPETVLWFQTAAQLYDKQGNHKQAKKYHKKADRLAKRTGWED